MTKTNEGKMNVDTIQSHVHSHYLHTFSDSLLQLVTSSKELYSPDDLPLSWSSSTSVFPVLSESIFSLPRVWGPCSFSSKEGKCSDSNSNVCGNGGPFLSGDEISDFRYLLDFLVRPEVNDHVFPMIPPAALTTDVYLCYTAWRWIFDVNFYNYAKAQICIQFNRQHQERDQTMQTVLLVEVQKLKLYGFLGFQVYCL